MPYPITPRRILGWGESCPGLVIRLRQGLPCRENLQRAITFPWLTATSSELASGFINALAGNVPSQGSPGWDLQFLNIESLADITSAFHVAECLSIL